MPNLSDRMAVLLAKHEEEKQGDKASPAVIAACDAYLNVTAQDRYAMHIELSNKEV